MWSPFLRDVRYQKFKSALWCCATVLLIIFLTISISLAISISLTLWQLLYFTLRHSPWGETSDTATVAVSTRGVLLLIWKNILLFSISSETSRFVTATVAAFDVSLNDLSRNVTTSVQIFGSERHVKKDSTFFPLNAENGFLQFTSWD